MTDIPLKLTVKQTMFLARLCHANKDHDSTFAQIEDAAVRALADYADLDEIQAVVVADRKAYRDIGEWPEVIGV